VRNVDILDDIPGLMQSIYHNTVYKIRITVFHSFFYSPDKGSFMSNGASHFVDSEIISYEEKYCGVQHVSGCAHAFIKTELWDFSKASLH
jgi:hypothetical protein